MTLVTPDLRTGSHLGCANVSSLAGAKISARVRLLVALILVPVVAWAEPPSLTLEDVPHGCSVRGSFHAAVPDSIAWSVLTDYDGIVRFDSSMRKSHVEHRDPKGLMLRQDAVGDFFMFHRRVQVLLDVRESPRSMIRFRDVLGKDFRGYVGGWRLTPNASGTNVSYELEAEPRTPMPRAVYRGMMRRIALNLLDEVRGEMLRRALGPETP